MKNSNKKSNSYLAVKVLATKKTNMTRRQLNNLAIRFTHRRITRTVRRIHEYINKQMQMSISPNWIYAFCVLCIIAYNNAFSQQVVSIQNKNLGLAVSSMVGPDGFGMLYLPTVYYKSNRSSYFMGPVIQKEKMNVSGAQFSYEYSVVSEGEAYNKNLELFFFAKGLYQGNALLGNQSLYKESLANSENSTNASQAHFKSVEFFGGFGLKIKLFKNVKWINSIGTGGYANFDSPRRFYYSEYSSHHLGVMISTGLSFDIK